MARPIKNTVDYFPHIIKNGKTIFILESKFGNDGYAFWFKLLELLGSSDKHIYDYNNLSNWEFLLAKTKVSEDKANSILKTLAEIEAIDKELLKEKIIWCENFVKGVEVVYKNRNQETPKKPVIGHRNPPAGVVSTPNNSHTILEDTIVENTKVEEDKKESSQAGLNDKKEIEFSFVDKCWYNLEDWQIKIWQSKYPMLTVNYELQDLMKSKLLQDSEKYKILIKDKYSGDINKFIWAWLEQAKKIFIKNHPDWREKAGRDKNDYQEIKKEGG